eukprot:4439122-Amphidinium_carterae.1
MQQTHTHTTESIVAWMEPRHFHFRMWSTCSADWSCFPVAVQSPTTNRCRRIFGHVADLSFWIEGSLCYNVDPVGFLSSQVLNDFCADVPTTNTVVEIDYKGKDEHPECPRRKQRFIHGLDKIAM